jgi:hypothetical protein
MANTHEPPESSQTSRNSSSTTLDKDLEKEDAHLPPSNLAHSATMQRSSTQRTIRRNADIDGAELVNLPSRTLGDDANMGEYLQETISGVIAEKRVSRGGKIEDYELVTWTVDDPENPKNWSKAYKW